MERLTFLGRLNKDDRAALISEMVVREHKKKATIISHEDSARDVYFVLEGTARATIVSESGKTVHLRNIPEGEIFGELAAIDDLPRSASIVAVGKVKCGSLSPRQFKDLVETKPSFTWALLSHLSQQSRTMTERIYEFSTMYVKPRLIRELLRLGRPIEGEDHLVVEPSLTQEDMAGWISSHREQVNRFLNDLEDLGLIDKSNARRIVLLDPDGLHAECEKAER